MNGNALKQSDNPYAQDWIEWDDFVLRLCRHDGKQVQIDAEYLVNSEYFLLLESKMSLIFMKEYTKANIRYGKFKEESTVPIRPSLNPQDAT